MKLIERGKEKLGLLRSHEIPRAKYMETLTDIDKQRIEDLITAFESSISFFQGQRVGIIAIGSSVKPEKERRHPVKDIDLRILSSHPLTNPQREQNIAQAVSVVEEYARRTQKDYKKFPYAGVRQGPIFLNYDDESPSFTIQGPHGSLPLHVSISSHPDDTVESHIEQEKAENQYFSVLAIIQPF